MVKCYKTFRLLLFYGFTCIKRFAVCFQEVIIMQEKNTATADKKPFKSEVSNIHSEHRDRMYERFEHSLSLEGFAPHEILELLLYRNIPMKNTCDIAHTLINTFGSFLRVLQAAPSELAKVKGMTKRAALDLSVIYNAMKMIPLKDMGARPVLNNTASVIAFVHNRLRFEEIELVYIICLDSADRVLNVNMHTEYLPQKVAFNVRTIVLKANTYNASKVILVHNHPSGDCNPSPEDDRLTAEAAQTLAAIEIPLLDHIIIAREGNYSYNQTDFILTKVEKYNKIKEQLSDYARKPFLILKR